MIQSIKFIIFKFLQFCFTIINRIKLIASFPQAIEEPKARVSRVIWRFKLNSGVHDYHYGAEDFVLYHEKYTDARSVYDDQISLFTITPHEAVFVDCGGFNVFGDDVAFMYISQYEKAQKVITIPIDAFHLIAQQIKTPKAVVVSLDNHGRCGSTLLYRIFQTIPNTLSMSEPYSMVALTEYSRQGIFSSQKLRNLCKSVLKCLFKHANSRESDLICLGGWSVCIFITDHVFECWPTMRHVYLYRQPIPFVQSWEKLQIVNGWKDLTPYLIKVRTGLGRNIVMNGLPVYTNQYLQDLSRFGKWALHWITCNSAYRRLVGKQYRICSVKFEDFLKDPSKMVRRIMKYCDIPAEKLPDVKQAMSHDSQRGSVFTSQNTDQNILKNQLTNITDYIQKEVDVICEDYNLPSFWSEKSFYLENNIEDIVCVD